MLTNHGQLQKKILVLGSQGQLGRAFHKLLSSNAQYASRAKSDFSNSEATLQFIESVSPEIILNAAAYTQVDRAESEAELAHRVNAVTPGKIAEWCSKNGVPFVHFSTDYVFSGKGTSLWKESDPIDPINTYGSTKAEGERKIIEAGGKYLIFRTSWIYDTSGKNFLRTILRLAQERDVLKIVNDQIGAPTFAADLAKGAWNALEKALSLPQFPSGIYHLCGSGETTWYHFAKAILEEASRSGIKIKTQTVEPILSSEFPTPAKRPQNSRMDTTKVFEQLQVKLPDWRESLNRGFAEGIKELK